MQGFQRSAQCGGISPAWTKPQTHDGYSALHTQHSVYLNGGILSMECESFHAQDSPFKYTDMRLGPISKRILRQTVDKAQC